MLTSYVHRNQGAASASALNCGHAQLSLPSRAAHVAQGALESSPLMFPLQQVEVDHLGKTI